MNLTEARQVVASIPHDQQVALSAAHARYMYCTGVYIDKPKDDHIAEDRAAFPHLLVSTNGGMPVISDEHCAEFMTALTGLPRNWCIAWFVIVYAFSNPADADEIDNPASWGAWHTQLQAILGKTISNFDGWGECYAVGLTPAEAVACRDHGDHRKMVIEYCSTKDVRYDLVFGHE